MDTILLWPHKSLLTPTSKVEVFDSSLHKELDDMKILLEQTQTGVGLAANQTGLSKSMFLLKDKNGQVHEIINPVIKETTGAININEGCLSAPGVIVQVPRAYDVTLEYQDRDGNNKLAVFSEIEAVIVQHECEHLLGVFFTSKTNRQQRRYAERIMEKY